MTTEEKAKAYDEALEKAAKLAINDVYASQGTVIKMLFPQLRESEDERMIKAITYILYENYTDAAVIEGVEIAEIVTWLEKQKENPKTADSIPSDCVSDAKCEDRWHKVADSLPDNGRLVLAQDCLGNRLLARYDGEGNWEVSVYDNNDYYCRNTITKWCEIPSEKQKEQKPAEWSDEDNIGWDEAFACVTRAEKAAKNEEELQNAVTAEKWLKEIKFKYYVHLVKQEWSEEDERIRKAILGFLNPDKGGTKYSSNAELVEWSDWLKSIRPQYHGDVTMTEAYKMGLEAGKASHWKPSEEQMKALQNAVALTACDKELVRLYDQLKKLI